MVKPSIAKLVVNAVAVLAPLFMSLTAVAQAFEQTQASDLGFRGQGRSNACVAFGEEQMLRDIVCRQTGRTDCTENANQWTYSIFDLFARHRQYGQAVNPFGADLTAIELLDEGSFYTFPYAKETSVRAAKCTLEQEIFKYNREANPNRERPVAQLRTVFFAVHRRQSLPFALTSGPYKKLGDLLTEFARTSASQQEFFEKVLQYRTCDDRLNLPAFEVGTERSADPRIIEATIVRELNRNRSVRASTCAEVFSSEKIEKKPCAPHVLVYKELRANNVRVVDSAFVSKRPRNSEGSIWIPLRVAVMAVKKAADDYTRKRAESRKELGEAKVTLARVVQKNDLLIPDDLKMEIDSMVWTETGYRMLTWMVFEVIGAFEAAKADRGGSTKEFFMNESEKQAIVARLIQAMRVYKSIQASGLLVEPSIGLAWEK